MLNNTKQWLKTSKYDIQNIQILSENALKDTEYRFKVLTGKDVTPKLF